MKIVLSRKGFDDKFGGIPSVIWPESKEMLSFPIPARPPKAGYSADSLSFKGKRLDSILTELKYDWKNQSEIFHLDPMIQSLPSKPSIGAFGQSGTALGHLKNNNISSGDIFLFFGTFCETYFDETTLVRFQMHPFHALWGYLKVDRYVDVDPNASDETYADLKNHPHIYNRKLYDSANRIYIGKDFGTFRFDDGLRLSKRNFKKSIWELPAFFGELEISHVKLCKIQKDRPLLDLATAPIGQEFVISSPNPGVVRWVEQIIERKIT